eukprot:GHVN01052760.1.p2 GENE.GHVN01052760.1~~GHVN01052760.1.p2  ORF type:complete len:248 (+),score=15.51 GHVN01052760.1:70-813(+)
MSDHERASSDRIARIYIGNLPNDTSKRDIEELFEKYGRISNVAIKRTISGAPFAFVEYDDPRDADDAIKGRDGYNLQGCRLRVEIPFANRGMGRGGRGGRGGAPRRGDYRVEVRGLPASGSWQDLKDHMRDAGECVYADVYRDGKGIVEFSRREEMERALHELHGSRFKSHEGDFAKISIHRIDDRRRRSRSPPRYGGGRDGSRSRSRERGGERRRYNSRSPPARGRASYNTSSRSPSRSRSNDRHR